MLESLKADDSFIQFVTIFPFVIGSQENSVVDFNLCDDDEKSGFIEYSVFRSFRPSLVLAGLSRGTIT